MKEDVFYFGKNQSLSGVITLPVAVNHRKDLPGVIILNSGLIHRIGPNRLSVKIARMLAQMGFSALRFDFSGIGDSGMRSDHLPFSESSILETQEAMDFLNKQTGVEKFVLAGICSGADAAFETAKADQRVVGIVPVDFYSVSSRGYQLAMYKLRMKSLRSWGKLITGKSELWERLKKSPDKDAKEFPGLLTHAAEQTSLLAPELIVADMETITRRRVKICLIYSAENAAYYNYRTLLERPLKPFLESGAIHLKYLDKSDHGFTLLYNQRMLLDTIREWMTNIFAGKHVSAENTGNPKSF